MNQSIIWQFAAHQVASLQVDVKEIDDLELKAIIALAITDKIHRRQQGKTNGLTLSQMVDDRMKRFLGMTIDYAHTTDAIQNAYHATLAAIQQSADNDRMHFIKELLACAGLDMAVQFRDNWIGFWNATPTEELFNQEADYYIVPKENGDNWVIGWSFQYWSKECDLQDSELYETEWLAIEGMIKFIVAKKIQQSIQVNQMELILTP